MPEREAKAHWIFSLWLPTALILVWECSARLGWLDPLFFPPPTRLVLSGMRMLTQGDLGYQMSFTIARSFTGFAIGAVAGLVCGGAMGLSPRVHRSLEPLVAALYSTPKLTLLPMLMLLAGVGETARLIIVAAGCFILVAMHTFEGVIGVDRHYVELARNYGAGGFMLFRKVYMPACTPQLFTGLRLAIGRALVTTLSVEMVSADDGLGGVIFRSWQTFSTERLYVAVILCAILGAGLHQTLRITERKVIPWRKLA